MIAIVADNQRLAIAGAPDFGMKTAGDMNQLAGRTVAILPDHETGLPAVSAFDVMIGTVRQHHS
jgi:hypothetical protein